MEKWYTLEESLDFRVILLAAGPLPDKTKLFSTELKNGTLQMIKVNQSQHRSKLLPIMI
jgi:hypothetical protein